MDGSRGFECIMKKLVVCALGLAIIIGEADAKEDTRILKAPFPAPDDHACHLQVNKHSIKCDLALYMQGGTRRRVQFNNDDSGHMVIFEGRSSANDTIIVDHITVGDVEGRPEKVRVSKATGFCIPHGGRTAECHAQTIDGQLFEASVDRPQKESTEVQCVPKTNAARILQSPNPNDIDPSWRGESHVGTSSTFIQKGTVVDVVGLEYVKGDYISPRGGGEENVFILRVEWDCASSEKWQQELGNKKK
jgi:hypothetical protein